MEFTIEKKKHLKAINSCLDELVKVGFGYNKTVDILLHAFNHHIRLEYERMIDEYEREFEKKRLS